MVRFLSLLTIGMMLAGCFQTSPQLKRYQSERDTMMAAGNRDQR